MTYIFPSASQRQFSGERAPARHALTAHVYGIKNFYTAMIRLYAAYNIHDPQLYNLAILTWVGVLFLFSTELFIWQTVRAKEGWIPIATSVVGLYWMMTQKEWYCSL